MFGTIKGLIPEPRQAEQPRHYVGRHRYVETTTTPRLQAERHTTEADAPTRELAAAAAAAVAMSPAAMSPAPASADADAGPETRT